MANKVGRPPGSQNKVGKDQKEFIKGLLGDTQEQFREAFIYYANSASSNPENRSKFMNIYTDLSKMIVPKPVEVDASVNESNFKNLLNIFNQWDEDID
ncbi:hypothetical protein L6472_06160 [Prevotella sp. E13-17]|uniref:hypothetical protein n=1 Tax=Prevotella sp. E13-17 TaxID=2913616 RepID=UPI001EDC1AE2|nr:hypothetical protein [Prevotella sp. E13-17]UKK52162.1 hypothetical protein L6472_06160 [Prevotella sp. E13-17]